MEWGIYTLVFACEIRESHPKGMCEVHMGCKNARICVLMLQ